MTPPALTSMEDRLRHAYGDAAGTVGPGDIAGDVMLPAPVPARRGRGRARRWVSLAVPAGAAAAVAAIAIAAVVTPHGRPRPPALPGAALAGTAQQSAAAGGAPAFVVTVPASNFWLDVTSTVTGKTTARIRTPMDNLQGGYFYSIAAQGPLTFLAGEVVGNDTYFYRLILTSSGTVRSITRTGSPVPGVVLMSSVTPDGRQVGYLTLTTTSGNQARLTLVIRSLVTSRVTASWPLTSAQDVVTSLSLDAAGTAMSVTSYHFTHAEIHGRRYAYDLVQATRVLHPETSGTALQKLPVLLRQGGPAAISPDGRTLYELVQPGLTARSWLSSKPAEFQVAAVSASTGATTAVLHTFHHFWRYFHPYLALSPGGSWLLLLDDTAASRISIPAGSYARLGGIRLVVPANDYDGSSIIGPLAW